MAAMLPAHALAPIYSDGLTASGGETSLPGRHIGCMTALTGEPTTLHQRPRNHVDMTLVWP
eukprot:6198216-Pleurochrysis_carterae.AAC.4